MDFKNLNQNIILPVLKNGETYVMVNGDIVATPLVVAEIELQKLLDELIESSQNVLDNYTEILKTDLENIFKAYAKCTSKTTNDNRTLSKILSSMQDCSAFSEQGYIDSDSVSLPMLKRMRFDGKPLEIVDFDDASQFIMDSFLEETKDIYTDERIYEFMEKAFGGDKDLNIGDIHLLTFDAFICLILATIKKDDEVCFYTVEIVDDVKIRNGDYIVPNLIFHRKESI